MKLLTRQCPQMWLGSDGVLLCSAPLPGLTQELKDADASYYGGRYFIGESICESAAKQIAGRFGAIYLDFYARPDAGQLALSTVQVGLRFGTYMFFDALVEHADLRERIRKAEVVVNERPKH